MNAALVILAAGDSRRLGSPKQLVQFHGETLLRHTAREACGAAAADVVVVLGFEAARMRGELRGLRARTAENALWREGIASSIRAGVAALDPAAEGVLICVCDQPHISSAHVDALLAAAEAAPGRAVASMYGGAPGVPAFFPRALFDDLTALRGDAGAKRVLASQHEKLITVPWPAGAVDIDNAEDIGTPV